MLKAAPRHPKHIINVEIDGPRHANARTRGFTQQRDEHLRLARGASGALDPDVTGAAEERDDEIMCRTRDLIRGL
jgi:hypothetical protein